MAGVRRLAAVSAFCDKCYFLCRQMETFNSLILLWVSRFDFSCLHLATARRFFHRSSVRNGWGNLLM
ncbi:hypothetical protein D9B73_24490 [Serratia marcescens]|nr:hypothetical protein C7M66_09355 [Serratia marcescens]AXX23197.1 hypothetical protein C7M65_03770 [Serratia marcescens]RTE97352.1 hypothetical protein C7M70_14570 [Serratia marcescens]RTF04717.1 hypothetical protein C7M68_10050 [Serratia marcescens]RTF10187.1 hypothetical protein C7M69_17565 [Serratia marcescens]